MIGDLNIGKNINKVKFINSNTNIDNIYISSLKKQKIYLDKSINDYLSYIYNISILIK